MKTVRPIADLYSYSVTQPGLTATRIRARRISPARDPAVLSVHLLLPHLLLLPP